VPALVANSSMPISFRNVCNPTLNYRPHMSIYELWILNMHSSVMILILKLTTFCAFKNVHWFVKHISLILFES